MRSASFYALVVSVTSVFCQHQQLRYAKNLRKAVPPHYNHDQKITRQSLDKVARGHKIEPYEPPLRPHQAVPWQRWVHEGRWAAQADKNRELLKVRAHLLAEKLKPIKPAFKPRILPQLKPKLNQKENARLKREVEKNQIRFQKGIDNKENIRRKREILTSEAMAQPQMKAKMSSPHNQYEDLEKREKRQILYFINRPPQMLARIPRTTPNPFIRDTHIEDYDIIRPEVGEREGMIRTLESGSSDPSTYPLMTIKKVLTDLTKQILNMGRLIAGFRQDANLKQASLLDYEQRDKRSPKMSKLKRKQKVEKKKRKKKKQKELSPRQLKHIRRKKEKKERRKMLHDKKLKEKRRLRHKKMGTGPYNQTIIDYYGIYRDPPSSPFNESMFDWIYDTSEVDSDAIYEERMKERYDEYPESETSEDSDEYYDAQIYGDSKESGNGETGDSKGETKTPAGSKEKTLSRTEEGGKKSTSDLHEHINHTTPSHLPKNEETQSTVKTDGKRKKKE